MIVPAYDYSYLPYGAFCVHSIVISFSHTGEKILKNQAYLQSLYWWLHWHVLLLHTEKYYLRKNFWITEAGLECYGKSVFGQVLEPSTGTLNSTWTWERTWCQDVVTNTPGKDTLESLSSFHFPMFNANEQSEELFCKSGYNTQDISFEKLTLSQ